MAESIKKRPMKMRGGAYRMVDEQILRWRKQLREEGIKLGTAMRQAERANKKQRGPLSQKKDPKKIAFFGSNEE